MWAFWLFLGAISLSIIPVALLWIRKVLDTGFKAVVTILLVPTVLITLQSTSLPGASMSWDDAHSRLYPVHIGAQGIRLTLKSRLYLWA
jgi:hypothetical protein